MFEIKVVEKIRIHILYSVTFLFFFEKRAIYEIISKNVVEPERLHMTIWLRVACWVLKATHTQAPVQQRRRTHTHAHRNM
jgi:hypothetical protein